jgi:hypothetical protein
MGVERCFAGKLHFFISISKIHNMERKTNGKWTGGRNRMSRRSGYICCTKLS